MPDPPVIDPIDVVATLSDTLDRVGEMLEARYPSDEIRRTLALVLVLEYGMEAIRTQWAKEHQQRHGCEM